MTDPVPAEPPAWLSPDGTVWVNTAYESGRIGAEGAAFEVATGGWAALSPVPAEPAADVVERLRTALRNLLAHTVGATPGARQAMNDAYDLLVEPCVCDTGFTCLAAHPGPEGRA